LLEDASWLLESSENKEQEMTDVKYILIRAKDVKFVEFMHKTWE